MVPRKNRAAGVALANGVLRLGPDATDQATAFDGTTGFVNVPYETVMNPVSNTNFSDEAVGLTRAGVVRILEARSGHPDPATLLAALAAEERAAGRTTATDFALACRRYAPAPRGDAFAADLRAADLACASGAAA